jgi:hypothetical protein
MATQKGDKRSQEMKPTNFVVFNRSATKFVAESLGLIVKGNKIYRKYPGKPITCQTCDRLLTIKNVGNFAKGKRVKIELYCDNFACLMTWVAINKL